MTPRTGKLWPIRRACRHCRQDTLLARDTTTGKIVRLEPWSVIVGDWPCDLCKGTGRRLVAAYAAGRGRPVALGDLEGVLVRGTRTTCPECSGTGNVGEPFDPQRMVVMSIEGLVKPTGAAPVAWDSVHRLHVCHGA